MHKSVDNGGSLLRNRSRQVVDVEGDEQRYDRPIGNLGEGPTKRSRVRTQKPMPMPINVDEANRRLSVLEFPLED